MKIKKIVDLCKKSKVLILYEGNECQWLSNGKSFYPLYGLPKFNLEQLCKTYDINEKTKAKIATAVERQLPEFLNFEDIDEFENGCTIQDLGFVLNGGTTLPLMTNSGIKFVDKKYISPLDDSQDNISIYSRNTSTGEMYFVLKIGFMVYGVVLQKKDVLTKDFIDKIENLLMLCKKAFNEEKSEDK